MRGVRALPAAHALVRGPGAPPPAPPSPALRAARPHAPPAARTRTHHPVALAARLPARPPCAARLPSRAPQPRAHAPRPRALPSPPRSRGHRAALLLLSPPSPMVAAAAAATQTLGSGGRAPRPEVTFLAASARAAPPSAFHPHSGRHPVLAALGKRAHDPPSRGPLLYGASGWASREPLPGTSRTRVLRPRSMAPRAEGQQFRPLPGPEARARPVRRKLPVSGEVPSSPRGSGPRACAALSPLRSRAGAVQIVAQAARATRVLQPSLLL